MIETASGAHTGLEKAASLDTTTVFAVLVANESATPTKSHHALRTKPLAIFFAVGALHNDRYATKPRNNTSGPVGLGDSGSAVLANVEPPWAREGDDEPKPHQQDR